MEKHKKTTDNATMTTKATTLATFSYKDINIHHQRTQGARCAQQKTVRGHFSNAFVALWIRQLSADGACIVACTMEEDQWYIV